MELVLANYPYWIAILLMMTGLYTVITAGHLIKKIMGLAVFQVSVLLFYIAMGYVSGGAVPVATEGVVSYINPLPHVLMLTAIVVGVATLAVGLALVMRIKEAYGTIEEDEIMQLEEESD